MPYLPWSVNSFIPSKRILQQEVIIRGLFEKILAFLIALLLWNYITSQGNVEVTYVIPIEYRNMPSDFEIVGDFPSFVRVRLRGGALILRNLNPQDVKVWVDLRNIKEGKNLIYIKNVKVPEGVKIVKIVPNRMILKFERIISKQLKVNVRWKKRPKFKWRVFPPFVKARGRKSILSKMRYISTEPVDPIILMKKRSLNVKIDAPAAINIDPETVVVEVKEK